MPEYYHNHYVPIWYQKRFFPVGVKEKKFYYLDFDPEEIENNGHRHKRKALNLWGPKRCFAEADLYTTRFGSFKSTEIEGKFFGKIDISGAKAVKFYAKFEHPNWGGGELFQSLLTYMSVQKLRTPKGLANLAANFRTNEKNEVLFHLQRLQYLYCTIWTESIWQIAAAEASRTKFIISDHPVTVYNTACFPKSKYCVEWHDPELSIPKLTWNKLGKGWLLMSDPRGVSFSTEILIGYEGGRIDAFDEYGRKPWDPDYQRESQKKLEWDTFHKFQGDFARQFGPRRRGRCLVVAV